MKEFALKKKIVLLSLGTIMSLAGVAQADQQKECAWSGDPENVLQIESNRIRSANDFDSAMSEVKTLLQTSAQESEPVKLAIVFRDFESLNEGLRTMVLAKVRDIRQANQNVKVCAYSLVGNALNTIENK